MREENIGRKRNFLLFGLQEKWRRREKMQWIPHETFSLFTDEENQEQVGEWQAILTSMKINKMHQYMYLPELN